MNLYHCQHCRADVLPILDRGAEKVRRFRSGWIARYLACGHLAPVTLQPVTVPSKCGRDITHPCHQPTLQGFTAATPNRAEVVEDPIPEPKPQRRQLALFEVR